MNYPLAPIFLSDLDNWTRPAPDRHIQGLYGHENPGKVMELKKSYFQAWIDLEK